MFDGDFTSCLYESEIQIKDELSFICTIFKI